MSDEQIRLRIDPTAVDGYLPAKGDAVIAALVERTSAVNVALQEKIVGEKLEGNPIKSHTHKLAGSVRVIPTENDGSKISGGVEAGGGPAFYAKFHEFGGTFDVPGRRIQIGFSSKKDRVQLALEAKRGGYDFVTHTMSRPYTITFPERSFMRSTLREEKPNIVQQLRDAVAEAAQ